MNEALGPAVWRGAEQASRDWIVPLDEQDCGELIRAAERLRGRPLDSIDRADFSLSRMVPRLVAIDAALARGPGFVMLRGLPAQSVPREVLEVIYWGIGAHLGVGVSQNTAGERLGQVFDRGVQDRDRYYTRGGALVFHMDPVDVVGLLCLRAAVSGGASRIVSAGKLHNLILEERPDLLEILYRGFHHSRRGHGESTASGRVPVFAQGRYAMECYFLPVTIQQACEEGNSLSPIEEEAIGFIEHVANRPGVFLDMDFRPGDIQLLNNRTVLHARTDYVDAPEPERKRHLLRLWLMMPHWPPRPAAMIFHDRTDRAGGGVASRSEFL